MAWFWLWKRTPVLRQIRPMQIPWSISCVLWSPLSGYMIWWHRMSGSKSWSLRKTAFLSIRTGVPSASASLTMTTRRQPFCRDQSVGIPAIGRRKAAGRRSVDQRISCGDRWNEVSDSSGNQLDGWRRGYPRLWEVHSGDVRDQSEMKKRPLSSSVS